jgi:DNA-directed RNA polymerase subunit E'/Rpb7
MNQNEEKKEYGVYINSMLSKRVVLKITEIGQKLRQNLEKKIKYSIEGKCITEGFIRPKTVEIVSYSCGLVKDDHIEFHVIYQCLVCNPIKDMEVVCRVKNITKAGIHAEVRDNEDNVPITVFVARDHNYTNKMFDEVEKDAIIRVKIIGVRFELNDPSITAIAYLMKERVAEEKEEAVNENAELIAKAEERYIKLKAEAEEREKYKKEEEAEAKRIKEAFGDTTGAVVYKEGAFDNNTKKRKIIIRK